MCIRDRGVAIAVDDGNIYWTNGGNLYRSPLGSGPLTATEINHGGWGEGVAIAVEDGNIYWTNGGNLYRSPLH